MNHAPTYQEFRLLRMCLGMTFSGALAFIPITKYFVQSEYLFWMYGLLGFTMVYSSLLYWKTTERNYRRNAIWLIVLLMLIDIPALALHYPQYVFVASVLIFTFIIVFDVVLISWPDVLWVNVCIFAATVFFMWWPITGFRKSVTMIGLEPNLVSVSTHVYYALCLALGTGMVEVKRRTERQLRFINENLNKMVEQKVAEIRIADREARQAQEQLDKILQHTPVGVVICDDRLNCLYSNGVHFKWEMNNGVPRELPDNFLPFELMHEILIKAKEKTGSDDEHHVVGERLDFVDSNQCERMLRYSCIPVLLNAEDGEAAFRRFILITEDITTEEVMRYKLIQADHLSAMGKMAAGLAHEINNPLSVIRIYIEALGKGMQDIEKREKIFIILKENVQRIDRIIKSFLTFGRQEKPTKEWIDVQTVLRNTLELATNLKQYEQIEIQTEFAADVPAILGDQHRLSQVFVNLLNNARDAMIDKGGTLVIHYERLNDEVLIQFKDTGKGISGEDVKHIFTPFFTTKEPGKGTGLGLSISYGIIQEHGGSIEVESKQGIGTNFKIRLPIPNMTKNK